MARSQRVISPFRKSIARFLFLIVIAPLYTVLVLIALPFIALGIGGSAVSDYANRLRFLSRFNGRALLIWSRRRGWRELILNNLIPVLPADVIAIEERSPRWSRELEKVLSHGRSNVRGTTRPYLCFVQRRSFQVVSLNRRLQEFKTRGSRSAETQQRLRELIVDELLARQRRQSNLRSG